MPAEKECAGSPAENRKSSKPIMEKRRRARINASLCELKSLLLEVMKKEGARHNKMEKADILEMTVKHLRQIQRQQFAVAAHADPTVVTKYQTGFAECAHEVTRYLSSVEGVDVDLKSRMLNHLANTVTGMVGRTHATSPVTSPTSPPPTSHAIGSSVVHIAPKVSSPVLLATGSDVNNNTSSPVTSFPASSPPHHTTQPAPASTLPSSVVTSVGSPQKIISGVQLIPTRLPNGEVAFVLPSNVLSNGHVPGYVIPVYSGAPTVLTAPLGAQTKPSTDAPQLQTVLTPNLPVTPTGSAQPTVLPAVLLPSVATVTKPCTSPDPLPMNLTSSQTPASPGDPPRTLPPVTSPVTLSQPGSEVKVKAESLTPGQPLVAEDVIRDKVAPPVEEDNVWRPW